MKKRIRRKVMDVINEHPDGMTVAHVLDALSGCHDAPTRQEMNRLLERLVIEGELESSSDGKRMKYSITVKGETE